MSFYGDLPPLDPRHVVEVGFDASTSTYWYQVFENDELLSVGLPGEDLKCLIDLVRATWGYLDWPAVPDLARKLRDDAAWVVHAKENDPSTRYLARALA